MMGPDPGVGRDGDASANAVQYGAAPFTTPEVHVGAPFGAPPVVPRWFARARLQALTLVWVVSVATLLAVGLVENLMHVMGKGLVHHDPVPADSSPGPTTSAAAAASRFVLEGPTRAKLAKTPICLMIQPPLLGGLSNSFGIYNDALLYASRTDNVRVVAPEFVVGNVHSQSQHQLFADVFTGPLPAMQIFEGNKPYHEFAENLGLHVVDVHRSPETSDAPAKRAHLGQMQLNGTGLELAELDTVALARKYAGTPGYRSPRPWDGTGVFNGCKVIFVAAGSGLWASYDYNVTFRTIRRMLWAKPPLPATCRDDPAFSDALGWPCSAWDGYWCGAGIGSPEELTKADWFEGYREEDLEVLRARCRRACRTCQPPQSPQPPQPPQARLSVSFHYRLGDVYKSLHSGGNAILRKFSNKLLSPNWIVFTLLLLQRAVPLGCGVFTVYTDGHPSDPPLQELVNILLRHGLPVPRILSNDDADARAAFEGLFRSDVLVAGTSGFGRLAGAANPGVVIAAGNNGSQGPTSLLDGKGVHLDYLEPMGSIPNVVEIDVADMHLGWNVGMTQQSRAQANGRDGAWEGSFEKAYEAAHSPAQEPHVDKLKRVLADHVRTRRPELAPMLAKGCGQG